MRLFLIITVIYALVGMVLVTMFRDNPMPVILKVLVSLPASLQAFYGVIWWLVPGLVLLFLTVPLRILARRLPEAVVTVFISSLFFLVFTMLKTLLPYLVPFWADPALAEFDRALHLGIDPWQVAHALSGLIDANIAYTIYIGLWMGPALYLPVLLVLIDGDEARIRRFMLLHAFCWIGLGNVLALAGMSAGPIFYDRLLGGDTFAPLMEALHQSGVFSTETYRVQAELWEVYQRHGQTAGSGISAFPSVHVGMATVLALYLIERSRSLLLPAVLLTVVFQFLSVYLGWHYAVDGYVSILVVVLIWMLLRRPKGALGLVDAATIGSPRHD